MNDDGWQGAALALSLLPLALLVVYALAYYGGKALRERKDRRK